MKGRCQPSQVVATHNKHFMIDCGETTQLQLQRYGISGAKMEHIFISHLHGDHCFGLLGMLSTFGMRGRTSPVYIHSHASLEAVLRPNLDFFCTGLPYSIVFEPFTEGSTEILYEDNALQISAFPLKHSVPTSGFLIREKPKERHLIREKVDFYNVPVRQRPLIKQGADFLTDDGVLVPNEQLTTAPEPSVSYAYCSDTLYTESIIPYIEHVDMLYHEASFLHGHLQRARDNMHSTALQAATIARNADVRKLVIGHFSARYYSLKPFLKEARNVFQNTYLAQDGADYYTI